jgi:hypothetical protein
MKKHVRKEGRGFVAVGQTIVLAVALSLAAHAEDPCTRLPDLCFPPRGLPLQRRNLCLGWSSRPRNRAGGEQDARVPVPVCLFVPM